MGMKTYPLFFTLLSTIDGPGLKPYPVAATTSLTKGQAIFDNGSGYATTGTAFAATFLGIAMAAADNSAGNAGDIDVTYRQPLAGDIWQVPVSSDATIAATDRGEVCDLQTNSDIDVTDNTCVSYHFRVNKIDISTEAVAANTYGFAIGNFENAPQ